MIRKALRVEVNLLLLVIRGVKGVPHRYQLLLGVAGQLLEGVVVAEGRRGLDVVI